MTSEEAKSININETPDDRELEKITDMCKAADPGAWICTEDAVARYGNKPWVNAAASRALMAASVVVIPRLIRGFRALEGAWRTALAEAASWRAEALRERDRSAAILARQTLALSGPESDLGLLHTAARIGYHTAAQARTATENWARGKALEGWEITAILDAERRFEDRKRNLAEMMKEALRLREVPEIPFDDLDPR